MTVEQKARAYDEALERVKKLLSRCRNNRDRITMVYRVNDIESIFPELKESKDEKIRKAILALVRQSSEVLDKQNQNNMIAWLEKQGERKPADFYCQENCRGFQETGKCFADGDCKAKREAESVDKVESKFHEGDWVVYNNDICQIVKREEGCNKFVTVFGIEKELVNERNLSTARLWTIQDAKDGDILIYNDSIFIFDEIYENDLIYYGIYEHNKFHNDKYYSFLDLNTININNIHPATKEQRDLLFQKIKEVGYDWDTEKKELKIIDWYKHIKYEPNCPSIIE